MADEQKPQITFYSHWLPAMDPGEYSVRVTPTLRADLDRKGPNGEAVTEKEVPLPAVAASQTFQVGGPRFALTGSEAYSCYPVPGAIGRFSGTLPHIVFDRCTLPWERTINPDRCTPWLGLILLSDSDFGNAPVPKISPGTVEERLTPQALESAKVVGPAIVLSDYENKDLCQTIDLPENVFKRIMPRLQDLQYLAHVRKVETDNKETWSLLKEGNFSVVICNRFPETRISGAEKTDWGVVNTIYLVSLEGWTSSLNQLDSLSTGKNYRLVVLAFWRFTCQGSSEFKSRIDGLNDRCLLGQRMEPIAGAGEIVEYINSALQRGFMPVDHGLRDGDTTVSWYRGPLVPIEYRPPTSYDYLSSADEALRYDRATGMLDASFAAAWQLGRLLALQDQAFAQALHRFRSEYEAWIRRSNQSGILQSLAKNEVDKKDQESRSNILTDLTKGLGEAGNMGECYRKQLLSAKLLSGDETGSKGTSDPAPDFPITVQNWLGQTMLLYGVPFHYLVPDEKMLPAESIRFFYINPDWIECLLQGACSLGRSNKNDGLADQLLRVRFFEVSQRQALKLRSDAKQAAERRREGRAGADQGAAEAREPASEDGTPELHWPLSGYLLRSAVVETWIGLEGTAIGVDSIGKTLNPLQILRMDRLAPDVLLCIYNGKVTNIEIKQPPEAVHFGAQTAKTADPNVESHTKSGLRALPHTKPKGNSLEVPMRALRVVDITGLVNAIKEKVGKVELSSADFAFEMIESPACVKFTTTRGNGQ